MVLRVGQELGTMENHELTRTTARVKVSVDGLKPLVKELIIEFDSGEETSITLEYEKLEYHCTSCFSLLHSRKNCPQRQDEEQPWTCNPKITSEGTLYGRETTEAHLNERRKREQNSEKQSTDQFDFKARVDRHGNPFGDRISTKQTRVAPPMLTMQEAVHPSQQPLEKPQHYSAQQSQQYSSPQYTQSRQAKHRGTQRGRDLFSQRSQGHWRAKQLVSQEERPKTEEKQNSDLREDTAVGKTHLNHTGLNIPSMEEVMEDLQQVTRQYLSCPDPVEAAARRQRVLQGDASGEMEETAAAIIAAETRRQSLISQTLGSESNPNTPPPNQEYPLYAPPYQAPLETCSPLTRRNEVEEGNMDLETRHNDGDTTPTRGNEGPAKLKSIVISPNMETEVASPAPQDPAETQGEEETLQEFQNKVRRRAKKSKQDKPSGSSLNILRGNSSKKRKISQIQRSIARAVGSPKGHTSKPQRRADKGESAAGTSKSSRNPPIQLIHAISKKKPDFRVPRPQAP